MRLLYSTTTILILLIPFINCLGYFVRKDFNEDGFYFITKGPSSATPYNYLVFIPGQKIKKISWGPSNEKTFEDLCPTDTLPAVIRDVQFFMNNYVLILGDDQAQCYNLSPGCYQFFSRPGKFEGRFENELYYFTSLWDPEQQNFGVIVATEPLMAVRYAANVGTGVIRFFDSIKTPGGVGYGPNVVLQQVDDIFKIIVIGGAEKSYTISAKVEYADVFKVEDVPKIYYLCTDVGELIAIDPDQPSILWKLTVEAGKRCTSLFFDAGKTDLVYMTTAKPNFISVDPSDRTISKSSLPEQATYIFRDSDNLEGIDYLSIITKRKILAVCHGSCSRCSGVNQADCLPSCDEGCLTCSPTSSSDCTSCQSGFYLELRSCVPCKAKCSTCDSNGRCLSCAANR